MALPPVFGMSSSYLTNIGQEVVEIIFIMGDNLYVENN